MSSARLKGVGVSTGRASGPVVTVVHELSEPSSLPAPADPVAEAARVRPAAEAVAARLAARAETVAGNARALLETTAAMAADPALLAQAEKLVSTRGLPAARAVYEAAETFTQALAAAGGYLAERVQDVRDIRDRIVAELIGVEPPGVPELASPSVLVARDLAPADTAGLDPAKVLALVTEQGGPTSHTAILARALGIPAVVACAGVLDIGDVPGLIVDGDTGVVEVAAKRVAVVTAVRQRRVEWNGVGSTADGRRVKMLANVGSAAESVAAAGAGAEGIGLFRTEFCYLSASSEPTVEAQTRAYSAVLAPFAGKPVVVRTLDAGADKPLPALPMPPEVNPFLGVRGIRLGLERRDVLV
ncbi:MAG: phosphoenolpyruvate--protein phosphotransferase, partial [Kutzneria sp.]|nr:phosphoenolpyruvate--protein phosphotransferase [Kutzneria sp.]